MKQWPQVRLGEVCEFRYGKSLPKPSRSGTGFRVFGSNGEVGQHHSALTDGTTIIVGRKGSFGEVAYSSDPCWPIDTTYYVDRSATKADLRWLYYRMKAMPLTQLNRAAAIPGLNREDAYAQRLLLPPIEEQRRIAAVLDAADALRAKRRQALAKLDTLTQAIFIDMFGDPAAKTLGWQLARVGDIASKIGSGATPRGGTAVYQDSGVTLIRSMNVYDRRFERAGLAFIDQDQAALLDGVTVEPLDVLLNITGASVARVCLAPADLLPARVNQHVAIIRPMPTIMHPTFLMELLTSASMKLLLLRGAGRGATREAITKRDIQDLEVMCPPLKDQTEFAHRCRESATTLSMSTDSAVLMDDLFASLQQRAFRGEL